MRTHTHLIDPPGKRIPIALCKLGRPLLALILLCAVPLPSQAETQLGPSDVLILVNADSPVSRSVADMYRRYYPQIEPQQVLMLSGLQDSATPTSTPADEIITRDDFESLIAAPTREHLISYDLVDRIYCLITTAGMPYRIEDSNQTSFADAIYPAGSNPELVLRNRTNIDAASVESELALLFQIDPALAPAPGGPAAPVKNRIINPYHGYASPIKSWAGIRDILGRRATLRWNFNNLWPANPQPRIEGLYDGCGCSAMDRIMSPADIYLVARLDGPHVPNVYPIFAVKEMLDRASAVSNTSPPYTQFVGYNPDTSCLVLDSSPPPTACLSYSPSYNYPAGTTVLTFESHPVPPGSESYTGCASTCQRGSAGHYDALFGWLTGKPGYPGETLVLPILSLFGGTFVWDDSTTIMSNASPWFPPNTGIIGLATYGCNGNDGRAATYLTTGGPQGGPLFPCVPGAVFTSIESFNAVTMFTTVPTTQAKIAEFIQMGGTAAIGHAFEPGQDAIEQVEFLYWNLMRDGEVPGVAEMTLVEAAFTAIPYLSWTSVLIGDPLMRVRLGPGGIVELNDNCPTDVNRDGFVGYVDRLLVLYAYNSVIGDPRYDPATDINQDGFVTYFDQLSVLMNYNTFCP